MRYLTLALVLCASSVSAQNADKTVEVQVQKAPQNPVKLLQTDQGNGANIQGAELSPDGKLVALYGVDSGDPNLPKRETTGVLQIWDVATRKKLRDLVGHKAWMKSVFWSHDGKRIVSQSQDGRILLWDVNTGKQLLVLASERQLPEFGQVSTEEPLQQLNRFINMLEISQLMGFSPDDQQIYAVGGRVVLPPAIQKTLNEVRDGKIPAVANDKTKKSEVNLPDYVFGTLRSWNARSGMANVPRDFGEASHYRFASALSADGQSFLVSDTRLIDGKISDPKVEQRDIKSGVLQKTLDANAGAIDTKPAEGSVYFSRISDDGRLALLIGGEENKAQLWDVEQAKPLQVLADSNANFSHAFFVAENSKLLVGGRTGDILIFDVASGQMERRLSGGHWGEIGTLDMTPDGKVLISVGDQDSVVQLWDLTKPAGATLQARALVRDYNSGLTPAPDGSFWSSYNNADFDAHDASLRTGKSLELSHFDAQGKEVEKISFPEELLVGGVTFSPDFKLAAASLHTTPEPAYWRGAGVGVWDLENKKLLWHLPGDKYLSDVLAFAPDGKTLVVGHGDVVELWDIETGKLLRQLLKSPPDITALTFSDAGQTLSVGSRGGTIQMLNMQSGKVQAEVTEDFVPSAVLFSPDGKYLLSGGNIELDYNPVGFKVTLRDLSTKQLLHEWSHDKGEVENRGELLYEGKDDGGRYFGGLTFSPDGKLIAFSHYANLNRIDRAQTEIWDIATNTRVGLIPDRASAQMPTFSSDRKTVFTTDGNWIKSWQLSDVLAQNAKP